MTTTAGDL